MNCTLLDFGCHLAQVGHDLWHGLSPASKLLIVVGILSIVGGGLWGAARALKQLGGWPAVIGGTSILLGLVLAILPKRRAVTALPEFGDHRGGGAGANAFPSNRDDKGPFQFGVDRLKPRKKRKTIFGG